MRVRIVGGYGLVQTLEKKFLEELESYNSALEGVASGYRIELVKEFRPSGKLRSGVYMLKYQGTTWRCPSGKGRFRRGGVPVEIVDKIPAPPRFKLEGFEAIVESSDLIVEYQVFRRYRRLFEGLQVEPVDVDVPSVLRALCRRAKAEAEARAEILGRTPTWVPVDEILAEVAEESRARVDDVKDSLLFAYDLGIVELEMEDGVLWFNIENSCLEVEG